MFYSDKTEHIQLLLVILSNITFLATIGENDYLYFLTPPGWNVQVQTDQYFEEPFLSDPNQL